MKVAVIGCGPSGLMAAHGATQVGAEVDVFSPKKTSEIGGAQYLHMNIPGITEMEPDGQVQYVKTGSAEGYASKVYGNPDAGTSWLHFEEGPRPCWSLEIAYGKLKERYWDSVVDGAVAPSDVAKLCTRYDLVFCTAPAPAMCYGNHAFEQVPIRLERCHQLDSYEAASYGNVVLYNGLAIDDWYRTSRIFGQGWTEYSDHKGAVLWDGLRGFKVVGTDCTCHLRFDNFIRMGRFGKWQRGVLTHNAYVEALNLVSEEPVYAVH